MRVAGWHIDGFGVFCDTGVEGLEPGLTVFLGENEAGKSTLLAFVRAMLFGFPDRRTRANLHEPLAGGRHGGHIILEDDGGTWQVARFADRRRTVLVTRPDRSAGEEADLRRLLAGVDAPLFASVFAFSLDELQQFASLDAQGVRELIFSAGISGAGRSAQALLATLAAEESRLLRQRGQALINDLARAAQHAGDEVRQAEETMLAYPTLVQAEERAAQDVADLDGELARVAGAQRRCEILIGLEPEWQKLASLEHRLAELPARVAPSLPVTLKELERRLDLLRRSEQALPELRGAAAARRVELARERQYLEPLVTENPSGPPDDAFILRDEVREWRRLLEEARAATEKTRAALDDGRRELAEAAAECESVRGEMPEEPLSPSELAAREAALHAARGLLHDLLLAELQAPPDGAGARGVVRLSAGAVVLALAAAAAAALAGAPQMALGLAAAAALLAAVLLVAWRATRAATTASEASEAARDRLRRGVAELGRELGVGERPDEQCLVRLEAQLTDARSARQTYDAAAAQWRRLSGKLETVRARVAALGDVQGAADRRLDAVAAGWRGWLGEHSLPNLTPDGALEFHDALARVRAVGDALRKADDEIAAIEAERESWREDAEEALCAAGRAVVVAGTAAVAAALEQLTRDVDECTRVLALEKDCRARITSGLSVLPDADEAGAELATGDIDDWRAAAARLDEERAVLNEARTVAIERRRDAQRERQLLERSADVLVKQAHLESLRAELRQAARRYRITATAEGLVRETLQLYVRERQPAVLALASRYFTEVTGGRFRTVMQESDDARDAVVVEQWDGLRLTPDQLSRGTCEQLYLVIRLALAAEFAGRDKQLPLLIDDCLVNFDPQRAVAMAALLAGAADLGQCLYFTCHPETARLLEQAAPTARIVRLAGRACGAPSPPAAVPQR